MLSIFKKIKQYFGLAVIKKSVNLELRNRILEIEKWIENQEGAMYDNFLPLKHSFADGLYIREIFMPKGFLIVSKLHRYSYPSIILKGDISMLTEEGYVRIKAPCSMISPRGTKRALYMHEDTVWITVDANPKNITDIDKLEDRIFCKSYAEIEGSSLPENIKKLFTGEKL